MPGIRRDGSERSLLVAPVLFDSIVEYLREEVGQGDLVVTMGAGNVWEIGRELVS
jgi:UDP-N-acetylmuramate-alanine ligase